MDMNEMSLIPEDVVLTLTSSDGKTVKRTEWNKQMGDQNKPSTAIADQKKICIPAW